MKFVFALGALWLIATPAHAQKSTMVQCQVGVSVRMVPDYVCDAMLEAFPIISFSPGDQARFLNGMQKCADTMRRRLTGDVATLCFHIWQDNSAHVVDDVKGRHFY